MAETLGGVDATGTAVVIKVVGVRAVGVEVNRSERGNVIVVYEVDKDGVDVDEVDVDEVVVDEVVVDEVVVDEADVDVDVDVLSEFEDSS
jgi:hypothetical protein